MRHSGDIARPSADKKAHTAETRYGPPGRLPASAVADPSFPLGETLDSKLLREGCVSGGGSGPGITAGDKDKTRGLVGQGGWKRLEHVELRSRSAPPTFLALSGHWGCVLSTGERLVQTQLVQHRPGQP